MMGFANSNNLDEASNNVRAVRKNVSAVVSDDSMRIAMERTAQSDALVKTRLIRKAFVDKMVQRRGTIQEIFRVMCSHEAFALMTRANFRKSLQDVLHLQLEGKDLQLLEDELYKNSKNPRGISLPEFSQFIEDTP